MFSGNGTLTNAANTYYVLASTNVALPLTNWTTVATQQFDLTGNFAFTNRGGTNGQQFYLLKVNWP